MSTNVPNTAGPSDESLPSSLTSVPSVKYELSDDEYRQAADYAGISTQNSRQLLGYSQAQALSVLPLNILNVRGKDRVSLLTSDNYLNSPNHISRIQLIINRSVSLVYLPHNVVHQAIYLAYRGDPDNLQDSLHNLQIIAAKQPDSAPINHLQLDPRAGQGEISKFLLDLMDYAITINASDIHILSHPNGTHLKLRLRREIMSAENTFGSIKTHDKIINRLKILAGLDINCRLLPQDGAFNLNCPNGNAKIRVALVPTIYGETAILRIHHQKQILDLNQLGFIDQHLKRIKEILTLRSGLILFCGSVGCGKSTTAAAALKYLIKHNRAISSVEDPVELEIPGVIHTQINPHQGFDYLLAIKSSLRQDPDALFVGEIRDPQTAKITLSAALTGHLTISTLHCSSSYEGLLRLINMGVDNYSLAASSLMYLHQRLLPRACENCKETDHHLSSSIGSTVYMNLGCQSCKGTGSSGTELIYNLNICNSNFKRLLAPQLCTPDQFSEWLFDSEQITFAETLKFKLLQGKISSITAREFLNLH